MLGPTDITFVCGQRGCGKSTLSKSLARAYPKLIAIDRLKEWQNEPDAILCPNFDNYCEHLSRIHNSGLPKFKIIVQFDVEAGNKEAIFTQVIRLAYKSNLGPCLHIDEIHHFAGPSSIDPWLKEVLLTGRHARIPLIGNSQRPANVSKTLVSQASHIFVGRLFENRDLEYLRGFMGAAIDRAAELQMPIPGQRGAEFIHFQPGQPSQIINT